ncbi:BREX-2 system phosphatase PglZ [Kitasatospora sp. NBC_00458]|uniref:BREX-2 system phosphatase PglZ n=1 Tax=Kitasatospora sp. NBC_00458 TaxID=2903568 RepID=UPI002E18B8B5
MLAQHLSGLLVPGKHRSLGSDRRSLLLVRAEPRWEGPAILSVETAGSVAATRRVRVVATPSPLAVYELALDHQDSSHPVEAELLVILTDREESELGEDLLSLAYRQRVQVIEPWTVVAQLFGVDLENVENKLRAETWAAEALIDATPPGGWTRPGSRLLSRDDALTQLAGRRLGLAGGSVGVTALLDWAATPGGPARFSTLRPAEHQGLRAFLVGGPAGQAGELLFALVDAGHGTDAAAYGLVCAALWVHSADVAENEVFRARGRAERFLDEDWVKQHEASGAQALDGFAAAYGLAAEGYVGQLIAATRARSGADAVASRRVLDTVLSRAEALVRQFGAESAAAHSRILRAGLEARFAAVGTALAEGTEMAEGAIRRLTQHHLADEPEVQTRITRAQMALRLVRWLGAPARTENAGPGGTPPDATATVASYLDQHMAETAWVDLALEHVRTGGDPDPALSAAYDRIAHDVRTRRHNHDGSFANLLKRWTAAGTDPGSMLTVESFLSRIVAPVVKSAEKLVLLVVLDGMSAPIAAELGDELRERWAEFDPLLAAPDATQATADRPRRRAMAAALPTLTAVSRTSLFAGRLMRGDQNVEKRVFPEHRFWGKQPVAVFHKGDLNGQGVGAIFGPELTDALYDGETHIAVVINTIDDRLDKEQPSSDPSWGVREIGMLRTLLDVAASQGRAVLITSDHGHVVEHGGTRLGTPGSVSNRHRAASEPLQAGEVELAGPRVLSPDTGNRIVALWDTEKYYSSRHAGYHGGASLAEFAIPVLALLPFGATPPKGWRELGDPHPLWWSAGEASAELSVATQPPHEPPVPARPKRKPKAETSDTPSLFDLGAVTSAEPDSSADTTVAASPSGSASDPLLAALLSSEIFDAQCKGLARKQDPARIEAALTALLDANGTLPVTALAQRVGILPVRADGFAATLRQILNFDSVQVLATLPDGRTLRLDRGLLRTQFGL